MPGAPLSSRLARALRRRLGRAPSRARALLPVRRESSPATAEPAPADGRPVYVLVFSIDDGSGVTTTMSTLANGLAADNRVEVISLFRFKDRPAFELDRRITLTYLEDARRPSGVPGTGPLRASQNPKRSAADRALDEQPTSLLRDIGPTSALTDGLLERKLSSLAPGVLISNRPILHQAAARWAPPHIAVFATEHSTFKQRGREVLQVYRDSSPRFSALVTLTEPDRLAYQDFLGDQTAVVRIPNGIPLPKGPASDLTTPVIMAAGALIKRKGFDRLIDAFAPLAEEGLGWQLHIYGEGAQQGALAGKIAELGLTDSVVLKGYEPEVRNRLSGASIYAMSSHFEALPMVLLESMGAGVPVVAFDCPEGPRQIITDGSDGFLVPDGDIAAYTAALSRLAKDDDLRHEMGRAAALTGRSYSIARVVEQWEQLFVEAPARGASAPVERS